MARGKDNKKNMQGISTQTPRPPQVSAVSSGKRSKVDISTANGYSSNMSVREWVEVMGGIKQVAATFGLKYKAVHNWTMYNRIPSAYHLKAFRLSAAKGIAFDPERPGARKH
jgi:hypothetical protein